MVSTFEVVPYVQSHMRVLQKSYPSGTSHLHPWTTRYAWDNWSGPPFFVGFCLWLFGLESNFFLSIGRWSQWTPVCPAGESSGPKVGPRLLDTRGISWGCGRSDFGSLDGDLVKIQSDNVIAVVYVNHQSGTRSLAVVREFSLILQWVELYAQNLPTIYIPGIENWQTDYLNQSLGHGEWALLPDVFHPLPAIGSSVFLKAILEKEVKKGWVLCSSMNSEERTFTVCNKKESLKETGLS